MMTLFGSPSGAFSEHVAGGGDAAEGLCLQTQDQPGGGRQLLTNGLGDGGDREIEGEAVAQRAVNCSGSVIVDHYPYRPGIEGIGGFDGKGA